MLAIVGAAGKVGYSTSLALRKAGVPVRAILRDPAKTEQLSKIGCEIAIADLLDAEALARSIADADAVQIILPASPQAKDTADEMLRAIESLAGALEQARPRRVLAISDYGAHVTDDIGMPSMFRIFEDRLGRLDTHTLLLRSAEHMEGWGRVIPTAIASGILPTFHDPVGRKFPTISAPDLGPIAAGLLLQPATRKGLEVIHAEGPGRYSASDVAEALGQLLGRTVSSQTIPRPQWKERFDRIMNASAAGLLIKVYDAHNKGGLIEIEPGASNILYGTTELIDALRPLLPPQ
ncbi:NAD(P)H-binding protein [Neorhizobium sp. BETTINA12A]|uniref:NmrA family NAD(P)-binding protein n=1 Tax=Neorhizobium sp. BETTINA12A TaxID=2908924 RepID=UPI001FF3E398|nr:NAD(P)H-binding protein [Neorhizobium sp. BETTINA12A]MCJ9754707.1 NAD(P)H-binding protein [Neorhizobium sp. BETTINA12A]